jgi:type IV pilus assembly protein PilV
MPTMIMHDAPMRRGAGPLPRRAVRKDGQRGFLLVEALVAILVFSLGILGVVGMQARSVQMMTDATFRAQAAQHASELIAEMWTVDPSALGTLFASSPAGVRYEQWRLRVQSGSTSLPGASSLPPEVTVVTNQVAYPTTLAVGSQTATRVTVTVRWQAPGSASSSMYTTSAMILEPQS